MDPSPATAGFLEAARNLGDSLLTTLQDRLKLFGAELQEEKLRLIQILIWISAGILAGILLLVFATLAVASFFWETARTAALVGISIFYLLAFVSVALGLRRFLRGQPRPFDASIEELKRDQACIRGNN
jgi:uncharacterized membrane protein YqjE